MALLGTGKFLGSSFELFLGIPYFGRRWTVFGLQALDN